MAKVSQLGERLRNSASCPCPCPGRTRLLHAHPRAAGHARSRQCRRRSAGLGPDRFGQDGGLRHGRGADLAGRSVPTVCRRPTGPKAWSLRPRANSPCRCAANSTGSMPGQGRSAPPALVAWTSAPSAGPSNAAPISWWARPAACATTSPAAPSTCPSSRPSSSTKPTR